MPDDMTPNLALPYIMAAQAQKHVTHNEAIRALDACMQLAVLDRDLATPPSSPSNGQRYIPAAGATGAWAGQSGKVAAFQDGAWEFYTPREGWLAWVADEDRIYAFDGVAWINSGGSGGGVSDPTPKLGINATADTTNRLAVSSPATLFNHEGAGHQVKVNKAAAGNTVSFMFQTAFSGRAEIGTTGDDDLHFKVSADGTTWREAIVVDRATGIVRLPLTPGREKLTAARTYYVNPASGSDGNNGLSAGAAFQTIDKARSVITDTLDLGGQTVTIQLADGTYAAGLSLSAAWTGGGHVVVRGNATTPASVVIQGSVGIGVYAPLPGILQVRDLKLQNTAHGIYNAAMATVQFANIDFGACGVFHIIAESPGARIDATGNYTISGGAQFHWVANNQGYIVCAGRTVTLTGTPAFANYFAYATRLSQIQAFANTYSGAATGTRYVADGNSLIFTNGAGANALPGNSAGSVSTGGQYV